ncbi:hypothetical protein [Rhodoblastus sp.]|jgi:hypothetical protein|uniref:hypothetical protein n=1 Tax=Rhodoblastus sp. TaxID=1962975 RepID=UPI0025EC5BB6|nr:hypothetical protein [Rhodoblastus sp.]
MSKRNGLTPEIRAQVASHYTTEARAAGFRHPQVRVDELSDRTRDVLVSIVETDKTATGFVPDDRLFVLDLSDYLAPAA